MKFYLKDSYVFGFYFFLMLTVWFFTPHTFLPAIDVVNSVMAFVGNNSEVKNISLLMVELFIGISFFFVAFIFNWGLFTQDYSDASKDVRIQGFNIKKCTFKVLVMLVSSILFTFLIFYVLSQNDNFILDDVFDFSISIIVSFLSATAITSPLRYLPIIINFCTGTK